MLCCIDQTNGLDAIQPIISINCHKFVTLSTFMTLKQIRLKTLYDQTEGLRVWDKIPSSPLPSVLNRRKGKLYF